MKNLLLLCVLTTCFVMYSFAQTKPFPQNVNYGNGFKPSTNILDSNDLLENYNRWKNHYLVNCDGDLRVEFDAINGDPLHTVSEGQGYAMVFAAYLGDKNTFDRLWAYAQRMLNDNGVMGWRTECTNGRWAVEYGYFSATDGDMDIAHGLCIAAEQWPNGGYTEQAIAFINNLKVNNFRYVANRGRWIQEPRDGSNDDFGNASYWSPGMYRVYQEFTGDSDWADIAQDTYDLVFSARNNNTGLFPDEITVDGTVGPQKNYISYDGCRDGWRYVIDYLWYGNQDAKNILDKISDWVDGNGIENTHDGYYPDGSRYNPYGYDNTTSACFMGSWACAAMTKNQRRVNNFTQYSVDNLEVRDGEYYCESLQLMYQFVLTGNYWKPSKPGNSQPSCNTYPSSNSRSVSNIGSNEATFNWGSVNGANNYDIRFRPVGTTQWGYKSNITGTSTRKTGLIAGTTYEWQIRTSCAPKNELNSRWSAEKPRFSTTGCDDGLLQNGCFEDGISQWFGPATETAVTNPVKSGSKAMRVSNRGGKSGRGITQSLKNDFLQNGKGTYAVKAFIRANSGGPKGIIEIIVKGSGNSSNVKVGNIRRQITSTGWTEVSGTFNANWSGTLTRAIIKIRTSNSQDFYVDDVRLVKGSVASGVTFSPDVLEAADLAPQVSFYPNPITQSERTFTLGLENFNTDQKVQVVMIDMMGKRVMQQELQPQANKQTYEFPLNENMSTGTYMLMVLSGETRITKKIVVQH